MSPRVKFRRTAEYVKHLGTHEITVELVENYVDAYYLVGVDCINSDGLHVSAHAIGRYAERDRAIRKAEQLADIISWGRE